ncbi:MAG TPA: DNA repair protein RecN [Lachnospiraceae bacterium]|nr:DNA repair protein RecN [Lachnospiraceae bacterium]
MLVNLHVKNFAIIDETDVDFGEHLNIMTGETGAGKSILIGSLGIALGGRVSPEMIGRRGDSATVEAVFVVKDEKTREAIRALDVDVDDDGEVVISRKITAGRSVNKINGESVPAGLIRQVASFCIDIHGQNEHQSLLKPSKQRELVDRFGGDELRDVLDRVSGLYREYSTIKKEMDEDDLTSEELARQLDYLSYEKSEIEAAKLTPEEMESIDDEYRLAANAGTVGDILSGVYSEGSKPAAEYISRVLPELKRAAELDGRSSDFGDELMEIESLLGDFNRELSGFMQDYSFDEGRLRELEQRLDVIHGLQSKYGDTYESIMTHLNEVDEKLVRYENYETYQKNRQEKFERISGELRRESDNLHGLRVTAAAGLSEKIKEAMSDLNFAYVDFKIEISQTEHFSEYGNDETEFLIATNPGEPVRDLAKIASGGELSRIMLAIKSVIAGSDEIETLIFDEIDTGISGRTAQMVSEKMADIAKHHQVIAITHLAQIAAMADTHFVIEKEVGAEASQTKIRALDYDESIDELSRILGGVEITDAVRENAIEMKRLANENK